ncbi:MAG: TIGR03557 family F420-dependent LLM class oxidoreductase [Chloroflexota bacterium]|nr:TIGR03557 family F420-dependent LLM class oxidoreductase [Chloroflexota bacterium]
MTHLGYALSSEEHTPNDLVRNARRAEEIGFDFALISDHFHPWVSRQGHSPFVWSVIGGIAQVTQRIQIGTGVTCPTVRIHPAIIAQAAATAAAMLPGRFFLGVGTGENLNEHIFGDRWPPYDIRLAMFEEALDIIRTLWSGKNESYWGTFYTVEDARLYTLPAEPPPIMIAASGPKAAEAAGRLGDGLINVEPDAEIVQEFEAAGGDGPRYGQITVCWAEEEAAAIRTAHEIWPNAGLAGQLNQELRAVAHFEQAVQLVTPQMIVEAVVCGPDPKRYLDKIQKYVDAGYDHIYLHQVGPDQEGFFRFCQREIMPNFT